MTIEELEKVMQEHGAAIRAVPLKVREVMEKRHAKDYADGEIVYMEEYHREMFVREYVPEHAGKFLIKSIKHTGVSIYFEPQFYDTIEDAVKALVPDEGKDEQTCGMR